jgi:hypothetical protein
MNAFTDAEISYKKTQRLGRLATVGVDEQPHVVPIGFRYYQKEDANEIGGHSGCTARERSEFECLTLVTRDGENGIRRQRLDRSF